MMTIPEKYSLLRVVFNGDFIRRLGYYTYIPKDINGVSIKNCRHDNTLPLGSILIFVKIHNSSFMCFYPLQNHLILADQSIIVRVR